ncbi:RhuM family protein [Pedobacter sp. BMA]|uniref:RhuM family protein n=1 Tax=Pedobacter sp. BMA TaxID=1663685 RepID=UPI00064B21C5|nr:RhuM family protein [Pedobacter sp. BMA]KLT65227.1 cytochrome C biogenesis protein CycH [Pedobacter sp. BMA]
MKQGEIIFYTSDSGSTEIEVAVQEDTLWLNQKQIAVVFGVQVPAVNKHINNIFKENELDESTISNLEIVQKEGTRNVKRRVDVYNLDMILSIGYRISSTKATKFRIWANRILKDYLLKGYVLNHKKLKEQEQKLNELKQVVKLIHHVHESYLLDKAEIKDTFKVLVDYVYALDILDQYDHQQLDYTVSNHKTLFSIDYNSAIGAIHDLRTKFGGSKLFGNEKDQSFESSLTTIYQTFDGEELYPSLEEKAAHLLYFVVKNHSFSDGNKRIAAFLFVWFLERNKMLYRSDGTKRIADNALVALTLLIAESDPIEKDMMIKVVINLINYKN